jgi:hypothetical protein
MIVTPRLNYETSLGEHPQLAIIVIGANNQYSSINQKHTDMSISAEHPFLSLALGGFS